MSKATIASQAYSIQNVIAGFWSWDRWPWSRVSLRHWSRLSVTEVDFEFMPGSLLVLGLGSAACLACFWNFCCFIFVHTDLADLTCVLIERREEFWLYIDIWRYAVFARPDVVLCGWQDAKIPSLTVYSWIARRRPNRCFQIHVKPCFFPLCCRSGSVRWTVSEEGQLKPLKESHCRYFPNTKSFAWVAYSKEVSSQGGCPFCKDMLFPWLKSHSKEKDLGSCSRLPTVVCMRLSTCAPYSQKPGCGPTPFVGWSGTDDSFVYCGLMCNLFSFTVLTRWYIVRHWNPSSAPLMVLKPESGWPCTLFRLST